MDGMNEIDGTLAEGAVPAMEAGVIIRLGSVDVELIVHLLGEVDTWGKTCELLAALHAIQVAELALEYPEVPEKGGADKVCLTDVNGGEASCEGYGLEVVSLLNSGNKIVSVSMVCALSSFRVEFPINKWDSGESGDGRCSCFNRVEGCLVAGPEACDQKLGVDGSVEEAWMWCWIVGTGAVDRLQVVIVYILMITGCLGAR